MCQPTTGRSSPRSTRLSKFEFDSVDEAVRAGRGERPGFAYLRTSNPTTRQLELTLAQLQGRDDCVVCASGIGVIAQTLLSLTRAGDHVLGFIESYGPTRHLLLRTLAKFGITHTLAVDRGSGRC